METFAAKKVLREKESEKIPFLFTKKLAENEIKTCVGPCESHPREGLRKVGTKNKKRVNSQSCPNFLFSLVPGSAQYQVLKPRSPGHFGQVLTDASRRPLKAHLSAGNDVVATAINQGSSAVNHSCHRVKELSL